MLPPLVSVVALPKLRGDASSTKATRAEKASSQPAIERRLQQARARRQHQRGTPQNCGTAAPYGHAAPHRRQRPARDAVDQVSIALQRPTAKVLQVLTEWRAQVRSEMSVAVPRRRRIEALGTALGQLRDTTQTMLDEIAALQRELSAVNTDEGLSGHRTSEPVSTPGATVAQQARLDGRASLSPSFRPWPRRSAASLGVTAKWFRDEAGRFSSPEHRSFAADATPD